MYISFAFYFDSKEWIQEGFEPLNRRSLTWIDGMAKQIIWHNIQSSIMGWRCAVA